MRHLVVTLIVMAATVAGESTTPDLAVQETWRQIDVLKENLRTRTDTATALAEQTGRLIADDFAALRPSEQVRQLDAAEARVREHLAVLQGDAAQVATLIAQSFRLGSGNTFQNPPDYSPQAMAEDLAQQADLLDAQGGSGVGDDLRQQALELLNGAYEEEPNAGAIPHAVVLRASLMQIYGLTLSRIASQNSHLRSITRIRPVVGKLETAHELARLARERQELNVLIRELQAEAGVGSAVRPRAGRGSLKAELEAALERNRAARR